MPKRNCSKITRNGQVSIPTNFREELNLRAGDYLKFYMKDGNLWIEPRRGRDLTFDQSLSRAGAKMAIKRFHAKLRPRFV